MKYIYSFITIYCLIYTSTANSQIIVNDMVATFESTSRPVKDIKVHNQSPDKTFMVETKVLEVINSGTSEEKRFPSNDLLISPNKFNILPKQVRSLRLIKKTRSSPDSEKVYRINLIPTNPSKPTEDDDENLQINVQVITSVGMLVFIEPSISKEEITWNRDETGITFANEGNINVNVRQFIECDIQMNCKKTPGRRLYPGNRWRLDLPHQLIYKDMEFELHSHQGITKIAVPYRQDDN